MSRASTGKLASAALLGLTAASCGGYEGPVEGARAYEKVEKLVSFGPRPAGSTALASSAAFIEAELRALGLPVQTQEFVDSEQAPGVEFKNIWTEIPGRDSSNGPIILLGAHYDTKLAEGHTNPEHNFPFVGAIDGAGASGLLLELARVLRERPNPLANIWIVWFDGEESIEWDWNDDRSLFGSRYFVKSMLADKIRFPAGLGKRMRAMVLMDLIGDRRIKLDRDGNSNKQLQDLFLEAAGRIGAESKMYKFRSAFMDDHIPFRDAGVRVIDLIDFHYRTPSSRHPDESIDIARYDAWWHTREDSLDKISADSLEFVGDLVWTAIPMIEAQLRQ